MNNLSKLVQMKLDVINYHADTITTNEVGPDGSMVTEVTNQKELVAYSRDACYTSHNSLQWIKKQIADAFVEYDQAVADNNARDELRLDKYISMLQNQLDNREERHDADKTVYFIITNGEEWTPTSKRSAPKPTLTAKKMDALRKRVA